MDHKLKSGCIAVFAKTPELSPLKTRLAEGIGQAQAEDLYRQCLECTTETLSHFQAQHPDWNVIWALGEQLGIDHIFWQDRPFPKMHTGDGSLGDRLHTVYSHLKQSYDSVVLIGSDCPQLSADDLSDAVIKLKSADGVIGPAHDGGYYLFGSHHLIHKDIWLTPRYSKSNTRSVFVNALPFDCDFLNYKTDLDTVECLEKIIDEMPERSTPAQNKIVSALRHVGGGQSSLG